MDTTEEMDAAVSTMKDFMLTYLMPETCYDKFFNDFNFLHVPCLKVVLSKMVGVWILLGTVVAPLPQLVKILRAGSSDGLSVASVLLQLYAISGPVVFCMVHKFPLSAYIERLFALVLTALIGFLSLHHRGNTIKGMSFLVTYGGAMLLLGSPGTSPWLLSALQASSVAAVLLSKVFQVWANYNSGHTGQLSSVSVVLVWLGSIALIFPSLVDTGKSLSTLANVLSACVSCVLVGQLFCYRNSQAPTKEKSA